MHLPCVHAGMASMHWDLSPRKQRCSGSLMFRAPCRSLRSPTAQLGLTGKPSSCAFYASVLMPESAYLILCAASLYLVSGLPEPPSLAFSQGRCSTKRSNPPL